MLTTRSSALKLDDEHANSVGCVRWVPVSVDMISLAAFGAAENMAIDQAILNSVSRTGVPVLRFYQWAEPTLSLGYFQGVAARAAHGHSDSICCVRRTTGGGAIVHDRELTYSVSIPVPASSAGPRLRSLPANTCCDR